MRSEILGDLPCEFLASVEVGRFRTRLQYASLLTFSEGSLLKIADSRSPPYKL